MSAAVAAGGGRGGIGMSASLILRRGAVVVVTRQPRALLRLAATRIGSPPAAEKKGADV